MMTQFPIKKFSGVSTKTVATAQDRGTLRRADGLICAPEDALSTPPTWAVAWSYSGLVATMATALSGATANKVHFVTIADAAGNTLLVAWDLSTTSARGIWVVASGSSAPDFSAGTQTITATNNSAYRDKTAALYWFGTWIGTRLFLGNGTDINLVWGSGALTQLGPSSVPTDLSDPSRYRFPPCQAFAMGPGGVIFAGGNVTYSLRLYASDPPTSNYPVITGLLTDDRSFTNLNRYAPQGSSITALSPTTEGCLVHLASGGVVTAFGKEKSLDGNLMIQGPTGNSAGAMNQSCVTSNGFTGTTYFGSDFEIYFDLRDSGQYGEAESRDDQIATYKSSGQWSRQMYRGTVSSFRHFVIDDTLNGRIWLGTSMNLGTAPGMYCFDRKSKNVTGPIFFPKLSCAAELLRQDLPGAAQPLANGSPFVVVGVSTAGALLYADLGKIGELVLPVPGTAIGAAYSPVSSAPTPTTGLCAIGIYGASMDQFAMLDSAGNVALLKEGSTLSPWGDWVTNGTTVPTITTWFNDAFLVIMEVAAEDFGSAYLQKDFISARIQWRVMQRAYCALAVQANNIRDYRYAGTSYPYEENYIPITTKGTRMTVRLLVVCFNGSPSCLPDVTIGFAPGTPA